MANYRTNYNSSLRTTNARIDGLMADFSGLVNLEKIVAGVLERINLQENVQRQYRSVYSGNISINEFDGYLAEIVRKELGKALGIVRNKAIAKARAAGAGDAATAVLRKNYKGEYRGNVNIMGSNKRISYRRREYPGNTGGASGITRARHLSSRTKKIYEYFGPDRAFILRFLESGTDVRTAKSFGPTGKRSTATYGNRGIVGARSFFGTVSADIQQAANELGTTLVNYVEKMVDKNLEKE